MIHLTLASQNAKTGPIPVSTSSADTCPDSCAFKAKGCYAKSGPLFLHWKAVTEGRRGLQFKDFLAKIKALPRGQFWRHNQAGDLAGINEVIETQALKDLTEANKGKKGFTYTHKSLTPENVKAIRHANENGFTVNISADSMEDADYAKSINAGPVVVVVPTDSESKGVTPNGNRWIVCPAQLKDNVTCATCQLCQKQRGVIIAFQAHGSSKKTVSEIVK